MSKKESNPMPPEGAVKPPPSPYLGSNKAPMVRAGLFKDLFEEIRAYNPKAEYYITNEAWEDSFKDLSFSPGDTVTAEFLGVPAVKFEVVYIDSDGHGVKLLPVEEPNEE